MAKALLEASRTPKVAVQLLESRICGTTIFRSIIDALVLPWSVIGKRRFGCMRPSQLYERSLNCTETMQDLVPHI